MKIIKKNLKLITLIVVMIIIIGVILIKYFLQTQKTEDVIINELELPLKESVEESQLEDVEVILPKVYVDIKGAVKSPGVYEIDSNKKVIDVVKLAGGFTKNADTSMINLAKQVIDEMVIIIYTEEEVRNANEIKTVVKVIEKECNCPEINNDACLNSNNKTDDTNSTIVDENSTIDEKNDKININSASLEELLTLSGIGESKALAIIEYREENGSFVNIEDIMNVPGIGEAVYEKIKDNITI